MVAAAEKNIAFTLHLFSYTLDSEWGVKLMAGGFAILS